METRPPRDKNYLAAPSFKVSNKAGSFFTKLKKPPAPTHIEQKQTFTEKETKLIKACEIGDLDQVIAIDSGV